MASARGLRQRPFNVGISQLKISPRQRLDDVVRSITNIPFGGTDCALPMVEALKHRWAVDVFIVYTDNETWAGNIHPAQALREQRPGPPLSPLGQNDARSTGATTRPTDCCRNSSL